MEKLNMFKMALFSAATLLAVGALDFYLFRLTRTLSYRLVIIFLSLIFLSNFISKLLTAYFDNKK